MPLPHQPSGGERHGETRGLVAGEEPGMVAYTIIVYFVALASLMFMYTITWDLFVGFMEMALASGADTVIIGYMYTIHTWIPLALLISLTIWFLSESQVRGEA